MVLYKATGISKEDGVKRLGPTDTSVLGVGRHLTEVEHWWFQDRFAGIPYTESRSSEEDPDEEFKILEEDTVESLIDGYKEACENSLQIAKARSLDDLAVDARTTDNAQLAIKLLICKGVNQRGNSNNYPSNLYRLLLQEGYASRQIRHAQQNEPRNDDQEAVGNDMLIASLIVPIDSANRNHRVRPHPEVIHLSSLS